MIGLCFLALALFDAWYTNYRMPIIGIEAEYNPFIRWLCRKYGRSVGVYTGVLLPTLLLLLFGTQFPQVLIFLVGCRTTLAAFQIKVLVDAPNRAR